jgi:hypothetical protein
MLGRMCLVILLMVALALAIALDDIKSDTPAASAATMHSR